LHRLCEAAGYPFTALGTELQKKYEMPRGNSLKLGIPRRCSPSLLVYPSGVALELRLKRLNPFQMGHHHPLSPSAVFLPRDEYLAIVRAMPISTIDLIVRDPDNRVLLGWRKNRPAKDSWFVPGGRLLKNETMRDGFGRICRVELGIEVSFSEAVFRGVYELFFDDNFAEVEGVGTHNISIAFDLRLGSRISADALRPEQHSDYRWFAVEELIQAPDVHPGAKTYFARD
jgi:colanic acid biosynthesis protein WcaH